MAHPSLVQRIAARHVASMPRTACIVAAGTFGDSYCLLKNRDRNYVPEIRVVHEVKDGVEVAYLEDEFTGWVEGLNEYGIGIVNAALMVSRDETERDAVERTGKKLDDGARILKALTQETVAKAAKSVREYKGGLKGHTIISDGKKSYYVEMPDSNDLEYDDLPLDKLFVRTNHGVEFSDAGYVEGEREKSSKSRQEEAEEVLAEVNSTDDIGPALLKAREDRWESTEMVRDGRSAKNMRTTTQMVLDLTEQKLILYLLPDKVKWLGLDDRMPEGRKAKIEVQVLEYKDLSIKTDGDTKVKKKGSDGLLPILDPAFNVREMFKQLVLLEDHLFHPRKRCPDCIWKHLLVSEALAEEAVTLDVDLQHVSLLEGLADQIRRVQRAVQEGLPFEFIAQKVREVRKGLLPVASQVRVASQKLATYFNVGDYVTYGKFQNKPGKLVRIFTDDRGIPMIEIEPVPKGRKKNRMMGLYRIRHADPARRVASAWLRTAGTWGYMPWEGDSPLDAEITVLNALDKEPAYQALREQLGRVERGDCYGSDLHGLWAWVGTVYLVGDGLGGIPKDIALTLVRVLREMPSNPGWAEFVEGWRDSEEFVEAHRLYLAHAEKDLEHPRDGMVHILKLNLDILQEQEAEEEVTPGPAAARVVARWREAKEFSTEKELKQYLRDHPKADPKKHWVADKSDGDGAAKRDAVADRIIQLIKRPAGWRGEGEEELSSDNAEAWVSEHTAQTKGGSVLLGTPHLSGDDDPESQAIFSEHVLKNAVQTARDAIKAGKKVVFLGEGEAFDEDALKEDDDWNEQHAVAKALDKATKGQVTQDTWDDAPVLLSDPKSPVWEKLTVTAGGNIKKARGAMAVFMAGQGVSYKQMKSEGWVDDSVADLVEEVTGVNIRKKIKQSDEKKLYDMAFPGDSGKPPTEVSALGDVYNAARQENLLRKIKTVEADGGVAIVTPGASHAYQLKHVIEGEPRGKSASARVADRWQIARPRVVDTTFDQVGYPWRTR